MRLSLERVLFRGWRSLHTEKWNFRQCILFSNKRNKDRVKNVLRFKKCVHSTKNICARSWYELFNAVLFWRAAFTRGNTVIGFIPNLRIKIPRLFPDVFLIGNQNIRFFLTSITHINKNRQWKWSLIDRYCTLAIEATTV